MLDKILKRGVSKIAGNFDRYPDRTKLSPGTEQLIQEAYKGLPDTEVWDYHAHILGIGAGNTGCYMNPELKTWMNPFKHMKYVMYADAAGVETEENSDQQYLERLVQLIAEMERPWKVAILALDAFYQEKAPLTKNKHKPLFRMIISIRSVNSIPTILFLVSLFTLIGNMPWMN